MLGWEWIAEGWVNSNPGHSWRFHEAWQLCGLNLKWGCLREGVKGIEAVPAGGEAQAKTQRGETMFGIQAVSLCGPWCRRSGEGRGWRGRRPPCRGRWGIMKGPVCRARVYDSSYKVCGVTEGSQQGVAWPTRDTEGELSHMTNACLMAGWLTGWMGEWITSVWIKDEGMSDQLVTFKEQPKNNIITRDPKRIETVFSLLVTWGLVTYPWDVNDPESWDCHFLEGSEVLVLWVCRSRNWDRSF